MSVCLYVCMFAIETYMRAHIATKLGMVVEGTQGQLFNALLVPQAVYWAAAGNNRTSRARSGQTVRDIDLLMK